jgi:hypothetical protein
MQAADVASYVFTEPGTMKKSSMQIGLGIALGAGLGAAVAVILGNGGLWLAIGVVVGIVIGRAMTHHKMAGQRARN